MFGQAGGRAGDVSAPVQGESNMSVDLLTQSESCRHVQGDLNPCMTAAQNSFARAIFCQWKAKQGLDVFS